MKRLPEDSGIQEGKASGSRLYLRYQVYTKASMRLRSSRGLSGFLVPKPRNSMKMKLSVVLGVVQMFVGLLRLASADGRALMPIA